jgi:drug/metabolite transporter (DMT)-like permease
LHLNKNLLVLHLTVFIWGFTAILGQLISIAALELVWYRMLIACISLFIYHIWTKKSLKLAQKDLFKMLGIGGIVALHWFFFYHSIKTSTISVALVCLSSSALFTSFLSPFYTKQKTSALDLGIGLIIIAGIILIFHFETSYTTGIIYGLLASLMASLFTILNEKAVKKIEPASISFYEMLGGLAFLSTYMALNPRGEHFQMQISNSDLIYLLILGTICTAIAYVMGVAVMKELSAYTVVLTTNLEPLYGIVLAYLIFGSKELMSAGFYQGAALILLAVFSYPFIKSKLKAFQK